MTLAARLDYLDSLRGIAIILMIMQHSALVLMDLSLVDSIPYVVMITLGMFSAPMFLMLVGAALCISVERRIEQGEAEQRIRIHVLKRGLILVLLGFLFMFVWEGEILRFIGISIIMTYYTLVFQSRTRLILGMTIVALSSFLKYLPVLNLGGFPEGPFFQNSWDFSSFIYRIYGDGYSMVFLWLSFVIFGSVLGSDLVRLMREGREGAFRSTALKLGLILTAVGSLELFLMIPVDDLPALHVMLTLGVCLTLLSGLIWIKEKLKYSATLINGLSVYGKLSLSIYIGHIVIWLGSFRILGLTLHLSVLGVIASLSVCYALTLALGVLWLKVRSTGPLELIVAHLIR